MPPPESAPSLIAPPESARAIQPSDCGSMNTTQVQRPPASSGVVCETASGKSDGNEIVSATTSATIRKHRFIPNLETLPASPSVTQPSDSGSTNVPQVQRPPASGGAVGKTKPIPRQLQHPAEHCVHDRREKNGEKKAMSSGAKQCNNESVRQL